MNNFTSSFNSYVCVGDTIETEKDGFDIIARIVFDEESKIDDDDAHSLDQSVTGCDDEQQQKLIAARDAWKNDEWFYCGIVLSIAKNGVILDEYAASLWSIAANYPESNNNYLTEVANELLDEALNVGKVKIKGLVQ